LPIRIEVLGERLPDESLSLPAGEFSCKKFVRKLGLSFLIDILPPLPPIAIPILFLEDYVWIAEGRWMVQGVIPPTNIDLSIIGIDPFYIPGLITKLEYFYPSTTSVVDEEVIVAQPITLEQNYPNPFNPSTSIQYELGIMQFVSIKVYDVLGNEIVTLVNEEKPAGTYEADWNASGLPSGVYVYSIRAGNFIQTKKMLLMK
jgi:hypothetical protein